MSPSNFWVRNDLTLCHASLTMLGAAKGLAKHGENMQSKISNKPLGGIFANEKNLLTLFKIGYEFLSRSTEMTIL